jgi:hypothetical protein
VPINSGKSDSSDQQVFLVAQLRAFLNNGESFDLVPIEHEQDVKSEVESLLRSWAESGFLIHGRFIYPWHQVKHIEVIRVEPALADEDRNGVRRLHAQDDFWMTRRKTGRPSRDEGPH